MLPLIDPFFQPVKQLFWVNFVIGSIIAPYISSFSCYDAQISTIVPKFHRVNQLYWLNIWTLGEAYVVNLSKYPPRIMQIDIKLVIRLLVMTFVGQKYYTSKCS